MAARSKRRSNKLRSIHDPPDPSPRVLPADARAEWGDMYREGGEVYDKDDLAQRAAWRKIKLRWKQTGKTTWRRCKGGLCYWPDPMQTPAPEADLVGLGVLVEYVFIDRRGRVQVRELDRNHPPILWWDDKRKMIYAFPKQEYPECGAIPNAVDPQLQAAIETYQRWHQRDPECSTEMAIPDERLRAVGAADSMSYASDKWNDADPDPALKQAQEYIHNHWYDVWVWQNTDRGTPDIIVIEGGELDLHERGLIH